VVANASSRASPQSELIDFAVVHGLFGVLVGILLVLPVGSLGARLFVAVAAYDVGLYVTARARGHAYWLEAFRFLMPLSVLQIVPDAFLSAVLHTLTFADTGFVRVFGHVPLFMGGMWIIPLFVAWFVGQRVHARGSSSVPWIGTATATLVGTLFFVGSEAVLWRVPIWEAREVLQVEHIAIYVVPAELVLSCASYVFVQHFIARVASGQSVGHSVRFASALLVMLAYLGALAAGYLVIEGPR
jgi:hypothetical protein